MHCADQRGKLVTPDRMNLVDKERYGRVSFLRRFCHRSNDIRESELELA
jgi:hypothetical protein